MDIANDYDAMLFGNSVICKQPFDVSRMAANERAVFSHTVIVCGEGGYIGDCGAALN